MVILSFYAELFKLHLARSNVRDYDRFNATMPQEDLRELRKRQWADPSGRRVGGEPWQVKKREPRSEVCWNPPVMIDMLQLVISEALERIAQAEAAAVIDTCTMLKAVVELTPHAEILALMEEGRLLPVTVPCLAEELKNQLGRKFIGEGEMPDDRRSLAKTLMGQAVMIGTQRDKFRDAHAAFSLRGIVDRNDRAAVAAAWRARSLAIPLVTDDTPLHEEAAMLLGPFGVAVMRTESFLDVLDQKKRE